MDFNHTETRTMLSDTLQRFLSEKYDDSKRREIVSSPAGMSEDIWAQLSELGITAALFSEEQGGFGGHGFDIAVIFEAVGKALVVEPLLQSGILGGRLLAKFAGKPHAQLLEKIVSGASRIALADTEAQSRYDYSQISTQAVAEGDGYRISGSKTVITNGGNSNVLIVTATKENGELCLFLVPSDADGVTLRSYPTIDGTHAADIILDNVQAAKTDLLACGDAALSALEETRAAGIVALCAEAVGAMQVSIDMTAEYLKTRKQFGRPLSSFQVLQHRMATLLVEMEQARSAVINVANALDQPRLERERNASAAKNLIGRVGRLVTEECIQMHGGIGMTDEYQLSQFARRVSMIDHLLGDEDYHMARFIALSREVNDAA